MNKKLKIAGLLWLLILGIPGIGKSETLIYHEKSLYRNIIVSESFGKRCMRFSRSNQTLQSCFSLDNPESIVFDCTKMMLGALYLRPEPDKILIIGLGGGALPTSLSRILPKAEIHVVELDPAIVRVAKKFFGFRPGAKMRVVEEDGRVFVKRAMARGDQYDLIMLDAFDHEYIPEHMLTKEFLNEVKRLLTPDGVLAANTFYFSGLYDSESATYEAVYGQFFNLKKMFQNSRVILLKNDVLPSKNTLRKNAAALEGRLRPLGIGTSWLLSMFSSPKRDWDPEARVLTDQYSPSNLLKSAD